MSLRNRIKQWLGLTPSVESSPTAPHRGSQDHVIILDGTMSSLTEGCETNAGLLYKLLCEVAPVKSLSLRYEAGIQWHSWKNSMDVIEGRGINRQIQRVYGFIASRYRPGDRIFLFGYSRGAYAVRSLADVIDQVGLLTSQHATVRNITQVYRFYQANLDSAAQRAFTAKYCHADVPIEVVGVWDTVKALGLRLPIIWMWTETSHKFHNHDLGPHIRHGFHALARDETREAFAPVLWTTHDGHPGVVEQMWFRGTHGDVGGQLDGDERARPLSNIPLVWMLEKVEMCGLPLPADWRSRFHCDPDAPSIGTMRGWGKFFIARRKRVIGLDPSEAIHPTALSRSERALAEDAATV